VIRTNILLGAIAGVTIFLGLPVARWRRASERLRGLLTLASAGVQLFVIIEVGELAMACSSGGLI
jgi:ZIP family zinc transporter